jgi:predicted transcriptional regulator
MKQVDYLNMLRDLRDRSSKKSIEEKGTPLGEFRLTDFMDELLELIEDVEEEGWDIDLPF